MELLDVAILVLRVVVGGTLFAHGAQKAFGWWGGPGRSGWTAAIARMGFRPAPLFAAVSIAAELAGALLLLGLLTPLAGLALIGQMVVIIGTAHFAKGFWNRDGGYEFALSLLGGIVALTLAGPGAVSLDAAIGVEVAPILRVVAVVIGFAGGFGTLLLLRMVRRSTA
jgi:putative oxidoreductase